MARILLATVALGLAPPVAAQAATPFTAGTGSGHDLAVGADGFGHVVWVSGGTLNYCRVPPGGGACDGESGALGNPPLSTPIYQNAAQVFTPAANKVVVIAACTQCPTGDPGDAVWRWISNNNGVSFGTAVEVGNRVPAGQAGYINNGDIGLSAGSDRFQALDDTPASATEVDMSTAANFFSEPSAVRVPDVSKVVWAANDSDEIHYSVFSPIPPALSRDALNNVLNWIRDKTLVAPEPENGETHLSTGPNGVLLSYVYSELGNHHIALRKFDPVSETFGGPTYVEGTSVIENNDANFAHNAQDPTGGIHVVWRTLYDGGRLRYTRSADGGTTFSAAANLATGESFLAPIVEASSATSGFAVWRTTGGSIRVVRLDPQIDPVDSGGPGGPGGPGTDPVPGPPSIDDFGIGDPTLLPGQGTTFVFNTNEAGLAVLTVQKRFNGRKVKRRGKRVCKPVSKRRFRRLRRKQRCKGWKKIGEIRQQVTAGRNEIRFSGRIAGRKLRPGRYRARLVVTDTVGNVSRVETLNFRVVKKKKKRRR